MSFENKSGGCIQSGYILRHECKWAIHDVQLSVVYSCAVDSVYPRVTEDKVVNSIAVDVLEEDVEPESILIQWGGVYEVVQGVAVGAIQVGDVQGWVADADVVDYLHFPA